VDVLQVDVLQVDVMVGLECGRMGGGKQQSYFLKKIYKYIIYKKCLKN